MKRTSMIPVLVVLILFAVLTTGSVYAASPEAQTKALREVIKGAVTFPDFQMKDGCFGDVEIIFTVSDEGEIQVEKMTATNDELGDYVKEALSNTCCAKVAVPFNQHYKVTFKFRQS